MLQFEHYNYNRYGKFMTTEHEKITLQRTTLIDWRNRIYDNGLTLGDRLQGLASRIGALLSGEPDGKYSAHVVREPAHMDHRATSWVIHRNSGEIEHTTNGKEADEARMVGFLIENQFPSGHPLANMSNDDIWHIAIQVATMVGGSLFNVSQHECVTEVRASFMDPDSGRAFVSNAAIDRCGKADTIVQDGHGQFLKERAQLEAEWVQLRAMQDAQQTQTDAVRDVLAERKRQIEREGWTLAHDDAYSNNQLPCAAAAYALPELTALTGLQIWPWADSWWKPRDPRRNYVRATALLLAEIERLDRAAIKAAQPSDKGANHG